MTAIITNPAANAVRHGLAGTRHVLPEHRDCVKAIEKDLIDTYKPECPDEHELLAEMALHRFRVAEIDRQQLIRDGLLKEKADEIAESESKEKFETLFKKFQNEPQHHIDEFKFHHLGAKFAATTWQTLAESAAPDGGGVTIEIAWQAVMTEGRTCSTPPAPAAGSWAVPWPPVPTPMKRLKFGSKNQAHATAKPPPAGPAPLCSLPQTRK